MKIFVFFIGNTGKMAKEIFKIAKMSEIEIVGGINSKEEKDIKEMDKVDVIIDFSHSSSLEKSLKLAADHKKPLVIGTTGYTDLDFEKIKDASKKIPIFLSSNFSLGISILKELLKITAKNFRESFVDIIEKHHIFKKDKPSGTAISLKEEIEKSINNKINIHSIRASNIVGEHIAIFNDTEETIEIKHSAKSRAVFAKGAIKAAKFICNKEPKLYSMNDLLGVRDEKCKS